MPERMTARKVHISDLTSGQWNKMDGMEPSFVQTRLGEKVSRARIMGTVVGKFLAEDGNFASITLDDHTDTIRAKTFKTVKPLDSLAIGDSVDVIAKVKEFNDEIYLIPDVVRKIGDPNFELMRRLEILVKNKFFGTESQESQPDLIKKSIIKLIEESKEGIKYTELIQKLGLTESQAESAINDLLAEGICYEPTPGKIRKI